MKLAFFDDFKLGVVKGDSIVDVSGEVDAIPHLQPHDILKGVIEEWSHYRPILEKAAEAGKGVPLSSVRLRPPVPWPGNIDCMAVNYTDSGTREKIPPINAFPKASSAIIGDGDTMVLPDVPSPIFEGEAELALVIAKRATNVPESEAMDYVFGYMNFIDGSARGLKPGGHFYQMKSRDTFAPIGPFLVTADEVADPNNLAIKLWNNGKLCQDFNTDDMANKIPKCIAFVSSIHTLEAGDILATGTNHLGLNPFQDGDKIELEVEGMGRLHVNVRDDLKRTWAPQTRLDRKALGLDGVSPQLTGKYTPTEDDKS